MANTNLQAPPVRANDFRTVEDLSSHINKLAALLRAAINCGSGDEEDESWLVGIAHEEAERAKALYDQWTNAPRGRA
jgi:hypothetical protein